MFATRIILVGPSKKRQQHETTIGLQSPPIAGAFNGCLASAKSYLPLLSSLPPFVGSFFFNSFFSFVRVCCWARLKCCHIYLFISCKDRLPIVVERAAHWQSPWSVPFWVYRPFWLVIVPYCPAGPQVCEMSPYPHVRHFRSCWSGLLNGLIVASVSLTVCLLAVWLSAYLFMWIWRARLFCWFFSLHSFCDFVLVAFLSFVFARLLCTRDFHPRFRRFTISSMKTLSRSSFSSLQSTY